MSDGLDNIPAKEELAERKEEGGREGGKEGGREGGKEGGREEEMSTSPSPLVL